LSAFHLMSKQGAAGKRNM